MAYHRARGSRWSRLAVVSMGALLRSGITSNMEFRGSKPDSVIGQNLIEKRSPARSA